MDSPERRRAGGTPIASSAASKSEDSPLFNFINNLSPLKPVGSLYSAHHYQSLNISSISSIFASPQENVHKENRISARNSSVESSGNEVNSDNSSLCCQSTSAPSSFRLSECTNTSIEARIVKWSANRPHSNPTSASTEGPIDLDEHLQFNATSSVENITPCNAVELGGQLDAGCDTDPVNSIQNGSEKRRCLFATKFGLNGHDQRDGSGVELVSSVWDIVPVDTVGLLACNPSLGQADQKGYEIAGLPAAPEIEINGVTEKEGEIDTPQMLSGVPSTMMSTVDIQTKGNLHNANVGRKVVVQQPRGMRRRCLEFGGGGCSKRNLQNDAAPNSLNTSKEEASTEKTLEPVMSKSPHILRGIGLHLNALASTSADTKPFQGPLDPGLELVNLPCSSGFAPSISEQDNDDILEPCPCDISFLIPDLEHRSGDVDFSPTSLLASDLITDKSSPKKRRRKSDSGEDGDNCKRCSCKKSKCLKLYCECFAAGVYCSEPCSCQGCLNKPVHEETVLSTRKQIEIRNPLAFAPKVIRTSDPAQEIKEDSTPASARHKRGCNCKKSSCLKKYCECFQGGVGCSSNCRCEGCKNTFGRRDGSTPDDEELKNGDTDDAEITNGNALVPYEMVPVTPPLAPSARDKLPILSTGKPPRPLRACRPGDHTALPYISQSLLHSERVQMKFTKAGPSPAPPSSLGSVSPVGSCVKTSSPNGKRVSPPHTGSTTGLISPSRKGGRKLILKSIPLFPSLTGDSKPAPS